MALRGVAVPTIISWRHALMRAYRELVLATVFIVFFLATTPSLAHLEAYSLLRWVVLGLAILVSIALPWPRPLAVALATAPSVVAFVAYAAASTLWSIAPLATLSRGAVFAGLIGWASALRLTGFNAHMLRSSLRIVISFLACVNALAIITSPLHARDTGIFGNPNHLGLQSGLLMPVALEAMLRPGSRVRRVWFATISLLVLVEGILSGSRGGAVAMAAGYVLLLWMMRKALPRWLTVGGVVVPLLSAITLVASQHGGHLVSPDNTPRLALWHLFPALFVKSPLFGHGFGTTAGALVPYLQTVKSTEPLGSDLHNSYLDVLVDLGIFGGILFAWILSSIARGLANSDAALTSLVVAGLVSGAFESWFFGIGDGFAIVFWIAAIFVIGTWRDRSVSSSMLRPSVPSANDSVHLCL